MNNDKIFHYKKRQKHISIHWKITTYYNIKFWVYIHHSTCKRGAACQHINKQNSGGFWSFQAAHIPLSSTTGSADTRCSTKIPSAVYSGVSARTTAMFWNVPMFSSSMVCFKNEGFGISDIWKQQKIVQTSLKLQGNRCLCDIVVKNTIHLSFLYLNHVYC